MTDFKENGIYKAKVISIEKYGVFVSLNDEYSGLVHISELCDGFVKDIKELVSIGEIINVKILDMSNKKN